VTVVSDPLLEKAHRLLTEGRLTILAAGDGHVRAVVRGDTGTHRVQWNQGSGECACSAWTFQEPLCSHVLAVSLIAGGWNVPAQSKPRLASPRGTNERREP
jgi:hypothetical protein